MANHPEGDRFRLLALKRLLDSTLKIQKAGCVDEAVRTIIGTGITIYDELRIVFEG